MRLRPRQYLLIVLILGLGVFNLIRSRRAHTPAAPPAVSTPALSSLPKPASAGWDAFDHAAALRDASAPDFAAALDALHTRLNAAPDPELSACTTWLAFFRQGVVYPSRDPAWRNPSTSHVDSCARLHRDVAS